MVLEVKSLDCGYGRGLVVKGMDLVIDNGEVTALMGPIGAGKSTVIKCILGVARRFRAAYALMVRHPRR
ncbi:MAG: ATP-binding cassette domain-containing protein [Caldivirga sp.]|jgi:ABC-type multidrug transport system ATPase subunit